MTMLAVLAMLVLASCNKEDDSWRNRDVTVLVNLLNHVWDNTADKPEGLGMHRSTIVFHRGDMTADVNLVPLSGKSYEIKGLSLQYSEDTGLYTCVATTTSSPDITDLKLVIDFNEQSVQAYYTLSGNYRVMATTEEVFFLKNSSTLTYTDGKTSNDKSSIYQFTIDPETMTATGFVGPLVNTKLLLLFEKIYVRKVPVTMTRDGYILEAAAPETVSVYNRDDSTMGTLSTIDARDDKGYQKFPITNFKVNVDLANGTHQTSFDMGRDDESTTFSVSAMGTTYKEAK